MSKTVLFLIHGIGKHGPNWAFEADGPVVALRIAAKRYTYFKDHDLDDDVHWVPIRYDDLFERILESWSEQNTSFAQGLKEFGGADDDDNLTKAVALMKRGKDDPSFFLTHVGDVVLYRLFPLFRRRVLLRVISKMVEAVVEFTKSGSSGEVRFYALAHSMGTSVAHDAIHTLGSTDWLRDLTTEDLKGMDSDGANRDWHRAETSYRSGFQPGAFIIHALFMLANTSEVLKLKIDPAGSIVAPVAIPGQTFRYLNGYYNVNHKYDPVSWVDPFKMPAKWGNPKNYYNIEVSHLYDANIHGFAHYLIHPDVHYPVLQAISGGFETSREEDQADEKFPKLDPAKRQELEQFQKQLEDLKAKYKNKDFFEAIQALKALKLTE